MIVPVMYAGCGCGYEVVVSRLDPRTHEERFELRCWHRCKDHLTSKVPK